MPSHRAVALIAAVALVGCAEPARLGSSPAFVAVGDGFDARGPEYRAHVSPDGAVSVDAARGAPIELRTASIGRGRDGDAPSGHGRLDGDGAFVLRRGEAVERLRAGPSGVEQSFEFAEQPRGTGDLVARIAVRKGEPSGALPTGVRLTSKGDAALVYGEATWIDARGVRTRLSPAFDGADIVVRVDGGLVDRSAYPAVLDPLFGPEQDIAPHGKRPWHGVEPAIACGTSSCLAVWHSGESAFPGINGLHIRGDGTPVDPTFFNVSGGMSGVTPRVAWDGSSYLVTYAGGSAPNVYSSRVGEQPQADAPVVLEPNGEIASSPQVGRLGAGFVTSWNVDGNSTDGRLVLDDGTKSNPLINPPAQFLTGMAGTATDVTFGFFSNGPTIQTFGSIGAPTGAPIQLSNSTQIKGPFLAALGSTKLAVWIDIAAGEVVGSIVPGPPFSILPVTTADLALTSDGANFWVTVLDHPPAAPSFFRAVPVDAAGNVGAPLAPVDFADAPSAFDAGCDPSGCLAVFSDTDQVVTTLRFGAQNDTALTPIGASDLGTSLPVLASDGHGYLALFDDGVQGTYAAERLDADGNPIEPFTTSVPTGVNPALTFDGQHYRVAWSDGATLDRVDRIPVLLAPGDSLTIPDPQMKFTLEHWHPDVACGPHECVVVDGHHDISAVSFTDQLLLEVGPIGQAPDPRIAWGAGRYYVAWNAMSSIAGTVVDFSKQSFTPVAAVSTKDPTPAPPVVAFDGTSFVVAWSEPFNDNLNLRLARVGLDQKVREEPATIPVLGGDPALVLAALGDGATTVLAWQAQTKAGSSVCFARYAGGVVEPQKCVDAGGDSCDTPALAARAPGQAMIGYVRDDTRPQYGTNRVKVRSLDFGDLPGSQCDKGDTCSTGLCRDGVCCDAPCDGPCLRCNAAGHCVSVVSADDPDSCKDGLSCDAEGKCVAPLGGGCNRDKDCPISGDKKTYCVKSNHQTACCLERCDVCQTCGKDGQCVPVVCNNGVVCSIEANECPGLCTSSTDCPDGKICFPNGQCETPPPDPTSFADCALSRDADGDKPVGAAALLGAAIAALGWRRRRPREGRDA